jgi:thiol:disulfide interchange protein DsbA
MTKLASLLMAFVLSLLAATPAAYAASGELREGIDYVRVSPAQPQSQPGIEVVEFFSYGCPHCNEFEPIISKWRSALPKDVHFSRVPISFGNPQWAALAKVYLAIETTGDLAKLDSELFSAIHVKKLPLRDEKAIVNWVAGRVADPKKFTETYQSFGVQAMAKRAEQTGSAFGISGVPSIGVGGRYLVVAKDAPNYEGLLRVTDRVIAMARQTPVK